MTNLPSGADSGCATSSRFVLRYRQVKRAMRARLITQRCGDGGRYAPPPPSRWVIRYQLEHCWTRAGGAARPSTRGLLEHRPVGWPVARRALLDAISKIFEIASSQSECSLMTYGRTDARTGRETRALRAKTSKTRASRAAHKAELWRRRTLRAAASFATALFATSWSGGGACRGAARPSTRVLLELGPVGWPVAPVCIFGRIFQSVLQTKLRPVPNEVSQ